MAKQTSSTNLGGPLVGLLLAGLLLGTVAPSGAQPQHLRFQHLPELQGASVHAILQDHLGYMWFGTQEGLLRYDGYTVTAYKHDPNDPSSLSHNHVRTLAEDGTGDLWIGTDHGGLNRWSRSDETFRRSPLTGDQIRALWLDQSGDLWIGTGAQGLDRLNPDSEAITHYRNDPANPVSLSDDRVLSLFQDRAGNLWVGTRGGLNRFDHESGGFQRWVNDPADPTSLSQNRVLSLYEDRAGNLWVGTFGGLNRLRSDSSEVVRYLSDPNDPSSLSDNNVRSVIEDTHGRLWIATNDGLSLHRGEDGRFVRYRHTPTDPDSLSTNRILTLHRDRSGWLWAGTLAGGINKWNPRALSFGHYRSSPEHPDGFSSNAVLAFAEDAERRLWIGTIDGGLDRWDRESGHVDHFRHSQTDPQSLSDDQVSALLIDRNGVLWIGTISGGLNRLDPATMVFERLPLASESSDDSEQVGIMSLLEDRSGDVWVGTYGGGLTRFDSRTGASVRYLPAPADSSSLGDDRVRCLSEDADGAVWVGLYGAGLNRFDRTTESFSHFRHDPEDPTSLSNDIVTSLHVDAAGTLWVGTKGGGLNRLQELDLQSNVAQFRSHTEHNGLPDSVIYGIQSDSEGRLWLSTNNGLARFDPTSEAVTSYGRIHGLQNDEFNSGAHYRSPRGEMFFGGFEGFNAFFPEQIQDRIQPPQIVVTSIRKNDQRVSLESGQLIIRHHDSGFSFEFAILDYTAPEKNRYSYMLKGFDHDWRQQLDKREPATYTNLDPGDYTFRVKGSNSDGVWSVEDATVKVQVLPASWETWWAYCAYVLALIGSVLGLVVWRVDEHKRRSAELERTVARRTGELAELVERLRHSERKALKAREDALTERQKALAASNAKSMFLSNMSHELRTPLNAVLGFTKLLEQDSRLADDHREYLSIIGHSGEHLLGLIDEVLTLSKIEAGKLTLATRPFDPHRLVRGVEGMVRLRAESKGLQLTVDVDPELPACLRGDEGRLRQVLLNLLGNAVKFTRHGAIALHLRWRGGNLEFEVADTGQGIARDEIEHLFEPFEQTSAGRLSREGTGLGLTISRQLVQIMGGDIAVESEVDKGTTFRFAVPLEPADPTALPRARRQLRRLAPGQPPVEVLVVDDAAENRLLLRRLLSLAGFTVREAADGGEAVQQWQKHRPRLIWMDMQMPVMDGYQASRRIRELESDRGAERTPIIALTATAFEQDRGNILAAGCDDVLVKPFRVTDLFAVLTQHLDVRMEEGETKTPATEPVPAAAEPPRGGEAPPGAAPSPGGDRRPRILVTEADDANRKLVVRTLQALGHRAEVVADSSDALALFRRRPYDLVLLDAALPDGLETTRQLRRESTTGRELRIVGMTSHPRREERRRCLEAGMNDVLSKPVGLDDLKAFLDPAPAVEKAGDTAEAPPTEALDRERLASLRQLDAASQEALLSQLIALFLETAPAQVDDLRQAIGDGDGQLLRQLAHSLKNRSSNIGAVSMAAACEELEQIGRSRVAGEAGNPGQTEEVLGRLRVELDRATAALEREWEREARPRNS